MNYIPYSRQNLDRADISSVVNALKSDWITQGPKIQEFEIEICRYTGAKYAVAVSSGTAALHLSMLALNIGKGDKALTTPITFSASANCVLYTGGKPEFVDIDDKTYHMDVEKLKSFLRVPSKRKKVKAVIAVHFMGTVADVAAINNICDKYGISVVEDAAHALGSSYNEGGKWIKTGSCRHSDITIFSFHPIKHITTGEGGALLTNDKNIYERVLRLRHHGIVKNSKANAWSYDIPEIGFNYRITDFQCALGISQLKRINEIVGARRKLVSIYNRYLSEIRGIRLPFERPNTNASYHLYVIRITGGGRNLLYDYLRKNNIYTQVNYIPVHLLTYYQKELGHRKGDFPVSERFFEECLSLPLYPSLSKKDQLKVVDKVRSFFR